MNVECNGVLCRVELRGSVISCVPLNAEEGGTVPDVFSFSEIHQLLRSRRDPGTAKAVVGSKIIMMRFVNPSDREEFIGRLQSTEDNGGANDEWVTSTICHTAVDVGILDEKMLDLLIKEEFPRGVVMPFDAIGALVDPVTFKLRPITDQLASDILRQIPVLAKIFERHVTDEETMQRFWEALVKKYFCFSRTFLEEEIRELETGKGQEGGAALQPTGSESFSSINIASGRALPKAKPPFIRQLPLADVSRVTAPQPHASLFCGRPSIVTCPRRWQCSVQPPCAHAGVQRPLPLSRSLPKENTSRDVLDLLKKFWGGDTNQRKVLRSRLSSVKGVDKSSILQWHCVQRAKKFLDELGPNG